MAPRRRARLSLTGTGGQLPLDRLVEPGPAAVPVGASPVLSETCSDTAINARRARWLEERTRYERARARRREAETASRAPPE